MLHTKLRENLPTGSGEEHFSALVSMVARLSIRPRFCTQNVVPSYMETLGQGQEMTLALINYTPSLAPLVVCI